MNDDPASTLPTGSPVCPTCGQRMLMREGVKLSPMLADIFDLIEASKDRGVNIDTLAWVYWSSKPKLDAKRCAAVNVNRLNDSLVETDIRVERDPRWKDSPYRVVRKEP